MITHIYVSRSVVRIINFAVLLVKAAKQGIVKLVIFKPDPTEKNKYIKRQLKFPWKGRLNLQCCVSEARNQHEAGSKQQATAFLLPHSCWFIVLFSYQSWRWGRLVPSKRRLISNGLYGAISQKIDLSIATSLGTCNVTFLTVFTIACHWASRIQFRQFHVISLRTILLRVFFFHVWLSHRNSL